MIDLDKMTAKQKKEFEDSKKEVIEHIKKCRNYIIFFDDEDGDAATALAGLNYYEILGKIEAHKYSIIKREEKQDIVKFIQLATAQIEKAENTSH